MVLSNTRRTILMTGMLIRFPCWLMVSSKVSSASFLLWLIAMHSITCWIEKQENTLLGEEYSFQTWSEGIDDNGRPIVIPNTEPMREGNLVWPSLQGATNWFSPSYNPQTEQFFVPNRRMGAIYFKSDVEYEPGMPFLGGGEQPLDGDDASGAILALRCDDRRTAVGVRVADSALVRRDGDSRRPGVRCQ